MRRIAYAMWMIGALFVVNLVQASTVAHWDFSSPNPVDGAFMPGNGGHADLNGDGTIDSNDFLISAADRSGNGNHLTAYNSEWMKWSADSVRGDFSLQAATNLPDTGTDSSYNPYLTGTDAEAIAPAQWTIEAVFKSSDLSGNRTIVGRDGCFGDNGAALYFSTRGSDLAIDYKDVDGADHNLQVPANLKVDVWYSVAAVSDGQRLYLYLNGIALGSLDLATTGTDTALAQGYGRWSVARGMWSNGHVDRFFGVVDEVAISDQALTPSSFVVPLPEACIDTDQDGMSDLYENFFRLDPANSADAPQNLDADALINFAEALLFTDPRATDTDMDGIADDADQSPLSRAVIWWGNPSFVDGDAYVYTGPAWWLGAGKVGGVWTNSSWTVPPYDHGQLHIDIDRTLATNNLILSLFHQDVAECQVYLDLGEGNGTVVAENLYGDVTDGFGDQELGRFILPLESYPTASRIVIDAMAGSEPYTVLATTLYEDDDADGLDAPQELQFGTLDTNPDTDGDTITDYVEVIVEGTDPVHADTDRDGFTDAEELYGLESSPFIPMQQQGGVPGLLQVERWYWIGGYTVRGFTANGRFGGKPDDCVLVDATEYAPADLNHADRYGARMRGTITAPVSGEYTFQLTGDFAAQVWLSDTENPSGRKLLLDLDGWTDFEDLGNPRVPSASVWLEDNQTCFVEILMLEEIGLDHVSLWWTLPGASEPEIIGSNYLHSYVQPAGDQDADGLPDDWEAATGLDPNSGIGGGHQDADGDAYSDIEEYVLGLDPMVADEDADGIAGGDEATVTLTDPLNSDTDGDGTPDLSPVLSLAGADFVTFMDTHAWSTWSTDGTNAIVSEAHSNPWVAYSLSVPGAGMYRLAVNTTYLRPYEGVVNEVRLIVEIDGVEVEELWMNHSSDLPTYTCFTPWLAEGEHTLKIIVRYDSWVGDPFTINNIELDAVDGADADGNGIQDWMEAILAKGHDTDGDGISDADELFVHGTGVLSADTDNDGLTDSDELFFYGSDALNADTDGDGVIDGVEARETLTDLLAAEFDGTSTTVLSVPGAQTNGAAGEWEAVGSELLSKGRRGYVEYTMDFPEQDLYCLNINAKHIWQKSSCSPAAPIDTSAFLVYVDDTFVGEYPLVTADGVYSDVRAFLPMLPAGEHTVRVFWDNVHVRLAVQIRDLQLQSLGGPDNNANGVKDWIEASIHAMAGVDGVTQSYISPACIEGDARYVPFMEIFGGATTSAPVANQGAGDRWYANLPLEQDETTVATASFQNGALQVPISIDWVPYNLMDHDGETLYIRKGDMVKFLALPEEAVGGQFEIEYTLGMDGETVRSPNTHPLIYLFPSAGTYTVTGEYTHGNDTVSAGITVVALDGSFPAESPACLVGKTRDWTFGGMPSNAVYEVDSTVELSVAPQTTNSNLQTVSLKASQANGEHVLVARTCPGGPVLDSTRLDTCWIQNAADGYFWVVESFEDSELWEVESIQQNLPPTVDLQIKVVVGGVTLDDYTLERWITNADYDGTGVYSFLLFHPNDEESSVCHTFKAYQDGQLIGETFGGEL